MAGWVFILLSIAYVLFGIGNELIAQIIIGITILAFGIMAEVMRSKINEQKKSIDKLTDMIEKQLSKENNSEKTE